MELRHIRYFLAVAEERNFTRAATRVGIGQPPLSQQIKDLEAEIGTPLFHRVPHGAELTEAGAAFLDDVRDLPGKVADAIRNAQRAGRGETGALRIGFTGSAAMNPLVPAAIRAFRKTYSQVALSLAESNTTSLISALRSGSIDVAFIRPGGTDLSDMHLTALPDEPLIAALPLGHPCLPDDSNIAIDLATLSNEQFILTPRAIGPSLFDAATAACEAAGFTPRLGQAAPQIASVLSLVAAAEGISLVPHSMRQLALDGVCYRHLACDIAFTKLALAFLRSNRSAMVRNLKGLI